jgi:hypothetical protein
MATTLAINQIKAAVGWDYETVLAYGNAVTNNTYTYSSTLAQGTGAGNASKIVIVQGDGSSGGAAVIAAAGSVSYDFSAFNDPFGTALSFSKIRVLFLQNLTAQSQSTTVLSLGGDTTNPWVGTAQGLSGTTPLAYVGPNGCLLLARTDGTGFAVDATHKTIKITNTDGANTCSYKLVVVGE